MFDEVYVKLSQTEDTDPQKHDSVLDQELLTEQLMDHLVDCVPEKNTFVNNL